MYGPGSPASVRERQGLKRAAARQVARNGSGYPHAPMAAPPTEHEILDVNRRYHDVAAGDYDAKWGIDYGEVGAAQVLGKLLEAARPAPRPVRALARDRRRYRLLLAQPAQGRRRRRATCTDISPGMLAALEANAQRLGLDVETAACDAAELPFEDASFDLVLGQRCCTTCPTSSARSRSSRACCGRAGRCSSPASRRAAATASLRGRSARRCAPPRCGAARCAPGPPSMATPTGARRGPRTPSTRSSRSSTCTRSTPATCGA